MEARTRDELERGRERPPDFVPSEDVVLLEREAPSEETVVSIPFRVISSHHCSVFQSLSFSVFPAFFPASSLSTMTTEATEANPTELYRFTP